MKIEIDYNGAFAVCRIEPMEQPGAMVPFNEADTASQTFALSAMRTVKEHWQREQRQDRYRRLPAMHIRREVQVTANNLTQLVQLHREGIVSELTWDITAHPDITLLLHDGKTRAQSPGWLLQDTEARWWAIDADYHRQLQQHGKIIIEE